MSFSSKIGKFRVRDLLDNSGQTEESRYRRCGRSFQIKQKINRAMICMSRENTKLQLREKK